jgi:hypothetical protein
MVVCTCHPSYTGSINRRLMVQTSTGINVRKISKVKRARA